MVDRFCPERLRQVRESVDALLDETVAATDARRAAIEAVPTTHRASARNLAHYLAVRAHDLRPLQHELAELSLSSLGRMEASVQHTLRGVQCALLSLAGHRAAEPPPSDTLHPERSAHLLAEHTVQLLGPPPTHRRTRILVTLSGSTDQPLLEQLLEAGMDLVRINLAHDCPEVWTTMVADLHAATAATGRRCRVLADLPGPKLRTGPLAPGPRVLKVRPERDVLGHVPAPARLVFRDGQSPGGGGRPAPGPGAVVPLTVPLAPFAEPGDELCLIDTRGRRRRFRVESVQGGDLLATSTQTTYLTTETEVTLCRGQEILATSHIGLLPEIPQALDLAVGDALVVTREQALGAPASIGPDGSLQPARISCTLPDVFAAVQPGQRILFDDGKIGGVVEAHSAAELHVRITEAPPGGARLRAEKGINLPDTDLHTSALTEYDLACLDWVATHADLVGMSFVQRPGDILRLHGELRRRNRPDLGIVLKIETNKAFERLPDLLFAGLQSPPLGVMVARGDLAVEVGYARLAEVQEEILWLCEAAHLPVIWATQVLDSMARTGVPSRAEVTDAAMGVRAECVMLNKGPHLVATTRFLGGLLGRMQEHHEKKRSLLRRLRVAGDPQQQRPHGP